MDFKYSLIRSDRKTLAIKILDGQIIVNSPQNLHIDIIENFLLQKSKWIKSKLNLFQQRQLHTQRHAIDYTINSSIIYMGGIIKLKSIYDNSQTKVSNLYFDGINLYVNPNFDIKKQVIKWYKSQALILVTQLMHVWQQKIQVKARNIKLSNGKQKLGYCTNLGDIAISWYLILQPMYIIEYVIIHELVHLVHFNHSPLFWNMVKYHCKNYEKAMEYLKTKGLLYFKK